MKLWKIGYAAMGILFAACSIVTGEYGLSKTDREIYDTAVSLDSGDMGFATFSLRDYKVRFYNGKYDYVVVPGDEPEAPPKIVKEEAVLDVFAGTTIDVDGEYQVLLPTYEQFSRLFEVLGTAETVSQGMSEGTMAFTEDSYSRNSQAATIWHEAFHAWQYTNWQEGIDALTERMRLSAEESREDIIVREVDSDQEMVTTFEQEMKLFMEAYEETVPERKKEKIKQVLELAGQREKHLSDSVNAMEYFLENLEGSAMYVEGMAYRKLEGEAAFKEYYLDDFSYENGSGKYYHLGMLKCLLLDEMLPGWQSRFAADYGLDELLCECVENVSD